MVDKKAAHLRLLEAIRFLDSKGLRVNQPEIEEKTGLRQPHFSAMIRGEAARLTEKNLRRFASAFPDTINEEWLVTGEGKLEKINLSAFRPNVPSECAVVDAGELGRPLNDVRESDYEPLPVISLFPAYDYTVTVKGRSMEPTLYDGDVVACRKLHRGEPLNLKDSHIYVIDTDEGALIKHISEDGDYILCHSDNPEYSDIKVPKDSIYHISRAVGLIRNI